MRTSYPVQIRSRSKPAIVLVLLVALLLTSACSGNAQVRQRSLTSQQQFQVALLHARQLGMTDAVLSPLLRQQQQLQSSQPPLSLFSDQPVDDYYRRLSDQYAALTRQVQTLMVTATAQVTSQAHASLTQAQALLHSLATQNLPANNFRSQLTRLQTSLARAQTFGDYAQVDQQSQLLQTDLRALGIMSGHLDDIKSMIGLLQENNMDTTVLDTGYQRDQTNFKQVNSNALVLQLSRGIDAQYQQAVVTVMQVAPQLRSSRLQQLSALIGQLPRYQVDTTPYQQRYQADSTLATSGNRLSFTQFQQFIQQTSADINKTQSAFLHAEADSVISQFHQDVASWSPAHMYQDSYDGNSYAIDTSYLPDNFGNDANDLLSQAKSVQDLQNVVATAQVLQFNHQLFEEDYNDNTPYNQVHQADLQALAHYHVQQGQVIVVSLAKQALRLYQDGKLVRAYLVTTGRAERPSPPGVYSILNRLSPTKFISDDPPSSPYWYPDTHINYAILMREGGYFLHDSWWRYNYGPGTQFPHYDSSGDQRSSGNGSHGCVNLPTDEAAWIYNNTGWNTTIIVY